MTKTLYAVDDNGAAIAGALFTFTGPDGKVIAALLSGANGTLVLDTDGDDALLTDGVHVVVSADGYANAGTDTDVIPAGWKFTLVKGPNYALPVIIGAGIASAAFFITSKNKKKVAGISLKSIPEKVRPWVMPAVAVGGVVVVYLLYNKFFGGSTEDAARDAALTSDIAAAGATTMSDSEIATTADAIVEDLGYSWVANNFTDAVAQLSKPKNTADVLNLVKAFGTHWITVFGIPRGKFTLEQYVSSQLPQSDIDFVNNYYDAQGINFKF